MITNARARRPCHRVRVLRVIAFKHLDGTIMRFLVTAGNTREKIDQVRDWGNIFTGNTGLTIAQAIAEIAPVDLLTSNQQHIDAIHSQATRHPIHALHFTDHASLRARLTAAVTQRQYDAIFMTAAVADYSPTGSFAIEERRKLPDGSEQWIVRNVHAGKVKSIYPEITFTGRQTEKLIDLFRTEWKYTGLLVKFKLEVGISHDELLTIARKSRAASGADYIVANTLEMVQGENPGAYLVGEAIEDWIPRPELAQRLARLVRPTVQ